MGGLQNQPLLPLALTAHPQCPDPACAHAVLEVTTQMFSVSESCAGIMSLLSVVTQVASGSTRSLGACQK